jgi:hypothetical protein
MAFATGACVRMRPAIYFKRNFVLDNFSTGWEKRVVFLAKNFNGA